MGDLVNGIGRTTLPMEVRGRGKGTGTGWSFDLMGGTWKKQRLANFFFSGGQEIYFATPCLPISKEWPFQISHEGGAVIAREGVAGLYEVGELGPPTQPWTLGAWDNPPSQECPPIRISILINEKSIHLGRYLGILQIYSSPS
jgi:hypothetical protein